MPIETTDFRSNPNDQIAHATRVIGKSQDRRTVFSEICRGKSKVKKASEIALRTGLEKIRVLQEGGVLSNNGIVTKTKLDGEIAYEKDAFYAQNKDKILKLAGNKKELERFPTRTNPIRGIIEIDFPAPKGMIDIEQLCIDDIDSFGRVRDIPLQLHQEDLPLQESIFKQGLQKILGEQGDFTDWGGETDDLYSTRLTLHGKRMSAAFGLKGRGTKGKLIPRKMGKNGDQVQRLFRSSAYVFIVQYWSQIDETILEQMKALAVAKSVLEQKKIYYGIIDGQDTMRILKAYPECFTEEGVSASP